MSTKKVVLRMLIAFLLFVSIGLIVLNRINNTYVSTFREENKGQLEKGLNEIVKKNVEKRKFSGSILVSKGDQIILNEGYGYARRYIGRTQNTQDTKYLLGSITKTFTASAIMQLEDRKLLSFDDQVTKYYPNYKGWDNVTVHQLLNHTSGIPNYYNSPVDYARYYFNHTTPEEIISRYKDKPLLFKPGTDFKYSNTNYMVLSGIIEKVTGESYKDYINKNIITPTNLLNTGYEENTNGIRNLAKGYCLNMFVEVNGLNLSNLYGAGGLYSSTNDLYKFLQGLNEQKLYNEHNKVEVKTDRYYGYGLTFENNKDYGRVFFHTGGGPGISTGMFKLVDKDMIIIILSNNQAFPVSKMVTELYDFYDRYQDVGS